MPNNKDTAIIQKRLLFSHLGEFIKNLSDKNTEEKMLLNKE